MNWWTICSLVTYTVQLNPSLHVYFKSDKKVLKCVKTHDSRIFSRLALHSIYAKLRNLGAKGGVETGATTDWIGLISLGSLNKTYLKTACWISYIFFLQILKLLSFSAFLSPDSVFRKFPSFPFLPPQRHNNQVWLPSLSETDTETVIGYVTTTTPSRSGSSRGFQKFLCFFVLFCFFVLVLFFYFIKISKFTLPGVMLMY